MGKDPESKPNERIAAVPGPGRRIAEIFAIAVVFFLAALLGFRFAKAGGNAPLPPGLGVLGVAALLAAALLAGRAKGKAALRESRARYEALFRNLLHGAAVFRAVDDGEDFEFVDYNAAGERIDRVDRKQVIGRRVTAVFPGVREFGLMDVLQRVWRTGGPERYPTAIYADQRIKGWRDSIVYKLPSGDIVSLYQDMTRQIEGKDRFLRQRELIRQVALTSPVGIAAVDRGGRISFANERARGILGLDPEEMAKRTFYAPQWELTDLSGRRLDADELPLGRAMATGEPVENQILSVRRGDGRQIILSVNASPLFSPEGDIDGAVATFDDVTDHRQAVEMLRESEARFRAVFDNALNAILVTDDDARYVDANPAACEMTGYDRHELMGLSLWDVAALEDPEDVRAAWWEFLSTGEGNGLFPLRKKDGTVITAEFRAKSHILPGIHLSVLNDVTERVASEAALRESEARFRQIAETIQDVFFLNDLESNRVVYVNPAYETVFGRRVDDLLADPADFLQAVHPEDREGVATAYRRERFGEHVELIYRIRRDEGDPRWIHTRIFPIRDEDGRIRRSTGLSIDITARKHQEEQLLQADKMISLGTLVAGVAHEINNPIGLIALGAPTLRSAWEAALPVLDAHDAAGGGLEVDEMAWADLRAEMPGLLDAMESGVRRIRTIVEHLGRFSRDQSISLSAEIDLNGVIDATLALLENPIRKATHRLSVVQTPDLPLVRGNFQRLEQILVNLILNACHALPDPDRALEIRTDVDAAGARAVLTVRDEGAGIPPENLKRVRDPFFTTRRESGGTGLGLAITARIVEQHDGRLDIRSEPGRGTAVEISFPSSETFGEHAP